MGALILSTIVWVVLVTDARALEPPIDGTESIAVEFDDIARNVCASRAAFWAA
jgi:hypothetical protein